MDKNKPDGNKDDSTKSVTSSISESGSEICIGDKCFTIRIPKQGGNVIIESKESQCNEQQLKAVQQLKETLSKGSATEYIIHQKPKETDEKH